MRGSRLRAGDLVRPGPGGGQPPDLRAFEPVDAIPTFARPAGSVVHLRTGLAYWLNVDGTATGWVTLTAAQFAGLQALYNNAGATDAARLANLTALGVELAVGGMDNREAWIRRGRALAGITNPSEVIYDSFQLVRSDGMPQGKIQAASGGTVAVVTTAKTAFLFSSSAGAGGYVFLDPVAAGAWLASAPGADRWHIAFRMRVTTAVDAATILGCTLWDAGTNRVRIGVVGPSSATHFSLAISNAGGYVIFLDTGVDIDNNWHTFELYRSTGNMQMRIDGVAVGGKAPPATWGAYTFPLPVYVYNGGTAADRAAEFAWYICQSEAAL